MTGTLLCCAQAPQDFKAVDARQHDVEHHQVDAGLEGLVQAAVALVLAIHGKSLALQEFGEQRAEFGVVIDQQDVHG